MSIDLERLTKLGQQLRWRTWPEERPKSKELVLLGKQHPCVNVHVSMSTDGVVYWDDGADFLVEIGAGDQWLPLSPLLEYLMEVEK